VDGIAKESFQKEKEVEREYKIYLMVTFMWDSLSVAVDMGKVKYYQQKVGFTKEIFQREI
jgi:hypothetical protein